MKIKCKRCGKEMYVKIDDVSTIPHHYDPYILRIYTSSYCDKCKTLVAGVYRIPLDRVKLLKLIEEL